MKDIVSYPNYKLSDWPNPSNCSRFYFGRELLVPMFRTDYHDEKLYLVSAHNVKSTKIKQVLKKYFVEFTLDNGDKYMLSSSENLINNAYDLLDAVCTIYLGEVELTIDEWLEIYPKYKYNYEIKNSPTKTLNHFNTTCLLS